MQPEMLITHHKLYKNRLVFDFMEDGKEDKNINNKFAGIRQSLWNFYEKKYKLLLWIPFIMLALSFVIIGFYAFTTGEFIPRDVSLKGGVILTIPISKDIDNVGLERSLNSKFAKNDITVRLLRNVGNPAGVVIEADIKGSSKEELDALKSAVGKELNIDLSKVQYGLEVIGSSLGESFFKESLIALMVAFLFMGIVVFFYFRTFVPSIAVVLAAFSDMVVALAVIHLLGVKIGTAGIAAFLMLIGYSVDTDILLTVRVLKRKEGTLMERIASSIKTGMTMTITAIVAVTVAMIVTQSEVIKQIMLILLIGLTADIINTWIQNVGLLRLYAESRQKKGKSI